MGLTASQRGQKQMVKTKSHTVIDTGRILFLPVCEIRPNPAQPRRVFDRIGLQELAASIEQYGVLQPLTVRRHGADYELVAGERRLRAARMAGLYDVPCVLVSVDEESSGMLALVENLQRRDLDFIEEAQGIARLMRRYGLSQEQTAAKLGKSQSAVANKLRLLRLPPSVLEKLREGALTERHARALLRLTSEQQQLSAVALIRENGWTVARTEQYIDSLLRPEPPRRELGSFLLRDARIFLNTVQHHLKLVQSAGIAARSEQTETEDEVILTICIPKSRR